MEDGTSHIHIDGNRGRRYDIRRRRIIGNLWEWVGCRFVKTRAHKQPGAHSQGKNSDDQDNYLMLREFLHYNGDPLLVESTASHLLRWRRRFQLLVGASHDCEKIVSVS